MLRVLNDDVVAADSGFGSHPHNNMEIISIPLSGILRHQDNMGYTQIIQPNEVQIMSAGTGVMHSEYNHSKSDEVNFLQIWILPKQRDVKPRYEQRYFNADDRINKIQPIIGPDDADGEVIKINQEAYLSLSTLESPASVHYQLHDPSHGVYIFVIDGAVKIADEQLRRRDGIGLWETDQIDISTSDRAELLFIEVPMVDTSHQ